MSTSTPLSRSNRRFNRASPNTKEIRSYIRSPTRRRFFAECTKPGSLLWKNSGSSSRSLNHALFVRAAQDPIDEVYERYPGPLYTVSGTKVLRAVKWRVTKDRNNWMGKVPKRELFRGKVNPYDWEKNFNELANIAKDVECDSLKKSLSMTSTTSTISNVSDYIRSTPDKPSPLDFILICKGCGVTVWFGDKDEVPKGKSLCYPQDYEWTETNNNIDPYCKVCWQEELKLLKGMESKHRAVGPKVHHDSHHDSHHPQPSLNHA